MKQTLLTFAAALAIALSSLSAQVTPFQDFIEKYRKEPAFTYALLSKDMFDVAVHSDIKEKDWKKLHQVVKNIGRLSILVSDSTSDGYALYREALALAPKVECDELIAVRDGKNAVKVLAKEQEGVIQDLVLLAGTEEAFVLVAFAGELELGNLEQLTRWLNADTALELAQSSAAFTADFNVSPNPATDAVVLEYAEPGDAVAQVTILDAGGRVVTSLKWTGDSRQTLQLGGITAGIYWIQVKTSKGKVGLKQLQIAR